MHWTHLLIALLIGIGAVAFFNEARARLNRRRLRRRAFQVVQNATANRVEDDDDTPAFLTPFGLGGQGPHTIPDGATSRSWEACHLFSPYGRLPQRTNYGLACEEPPLASVCPECDCRAPVIHPGMRRRCRYCGSILHAHGTRVYFWHE